jgi:uncharacterized protein YndB with AHSA1/START domain
MTDASFVYETTIATTPDRLWQALTSGDITRAYWFDRRIESAWTVGAPVRFFDGAGDVVTDTGEVLVCEPPRRLTYTFTPGTDGHRTRVSFDLEPVAGGVRLRLVHDRLAAAEDVAGWRSGWTPILTNLAALLEGREPDAPPVRGDDDDTPPTLTRRIPRPPGEVFAALTDPAAVARWWRPAGATTEVHAVDARPGGTFSLTVRLAAGPVAELRGDYLQVQAPRLLVHTLRADGDPRETVVTWRLVPDGEDTLLELTETGPGAGSAEGWAEGVDNLVALLLTAVPKS